MDIFLFEIKSDTEMLKYPDVNNWISFMLRVIFLSSLISDLIKEIFMFLLFKDK